MVRFLLCKFILASARLIFYRVIAASFRMHVYYRQQKSLRNFRLGGFYVWLCCLTYDARPPCGFFTALVVLLIVIMVTANIFVSLSKGNGAPLPGRPSRNRLGNVQTIHGYLWKVNNFYFQARIQLSASHIFISPWLLCKFPTPPVPLCSRNFPNLQLYHSMI